MTNIEHLDRSNNDSAGVKTIVDEALCAFWQVVAKRHPEFTTGELSPCMTHLLEEMAIEAVTEWRANNSPSSEAV